MTFTMIIQLLIVLAALYVGSRYGSLALGAISGIGLAVLVFGFGLKPGTPPTDVIYIIIAAVTCAGTLQASGGMDWIGLFIGSFANKSLIKEFNSFEKLLSSSFGIVVNKFY